MHKENRMKKFSLIGLLIVAVMAGCAEPQPGPGVIGPKAAYAKWQASSDNTYILDVRTPSEYIFIGHAPMARNIPSKFLANRWDAKEKKPAMIPNPNFVAEVKKYYKPDDTIMVMCGSGKRSAAAVKLLRESGFKNVLDIEGGFGGQRGTDCSDNGAGKLIKPGWVHSDLVWTMAIDPDSLYAPEGPAASNPAIQAGS
jgi:rhodanese-related sulfurtransferase